MGLEKTIPMCRRIWRRDSPRNDRSQIPSKKTEPEVGSIKRSIARAAVLLPQPLSPTNPTVSDSRMVRFDAIDGAHGLPNRPQTFHTRHPRNA